MKKVKLTKKEIGILSSMLLDETKKEKPSIEKVSLWVKLGADVNAKGHNGWSSLILASTHGHLNIVDFLVAKGARVNARDFRRATALMYASGRGHLDIAKFLISAGAYVDAKDSHGWTASMWASNRNHAFVCGDSHTGPSDAIRK